LSYNNSHAYTKFREDRSAGSGIAFGRNTNTHGNKMAVTRRQNGDLTQRQNGDLTQRQNGDLTQKQNGDLRILPLKMAKMILG